MAMASELCPTCAFAPRDERVSVHPGRLRGVEQFHVVDQLGRRRHGGAGRRGTTEAAPAPKARVTVHVRQGQHLAKRRRWVGCGRGTSGGYHLRATTFNAALLSMVPAVSVTAIPGRD
jgi:hypothetical protein